VKVGIIAIVAAGYLPLLSLAQQPQQFLQAELVKTIKAKSARTGDPVKARAVNAVVLPGAVTISVGTILLGEVRAADPNSLSISFDQAELNGKKTPLSLSIRAAMMPGHPPKSLGDAENTSLDASTPNAHPIQGGPAQLSDKTENAAKNATTPDSGGVSRPAVAAQTGSVIGMPGVSLQVDDSPRHASKFESSGKELQLKQGLQLMLAVPE
jgi:hypothetical protein